MSSNLLKDFPILATDTNPEDTIFMLPSVRVEIPLSKFEGLSLLDRMALESKMVVNEVVAAARRGEVGMIKNVKLP